jgi:endonuclease YncB( thermonuclease family)
VRSPVLLLAVVLSACSSVEPRDAADAGPTDAAERRDASSPDAESPDVGLPVTPACPAPASLQPADVPAGYLAAETVGYVSTTDGDTAHFRFVVGEEIVRLLYVNTEESHGGLTTAFGSSTEDIVRGWISSAHEIVVVVREEPRMPGTPDLDPYDRWLGLVFLDGELLETRLIREGYSVYYTKFGCAPEPFHSAFVNAESEANENHRGVWSEGHPTDYRPILAAWIPSSACRPNPFLEPYCP